MNFTRFTVEETRYPQVDSAAVISELLAVFREILSLARNMKTSRGYRLLLKVREGKFVPSLEIHPNDGWRRLKSTKDLPSSPLYGELPSEEYRRSIVNFVPQLRQFLLEEEDLAREEAFEFENTVASTQCALNLDSTPKKFRNKACKCQKTIATLLGSSMPCPFQRFNDVDVTKKFNLNEKESIFKVLVEYGNSPSLVVVAPLEKQSAVHNNEEMVLNQTFIEVVVSVFSQIKQKTGTYPIMMTMNFGAWESEIQRYPFLSECHGHAHIHLSRAAGIAVKWKKRLQIPELYRRQNVEEFRSVLDKVERYVFEDQMIKMMSKMQETLDKVWQSINQNKRRFSY